MMARWLSTLFILLLTVVSSFAQDFPSPNFDRLTIQQEVNYTDKPQWIDATPIFHEMAVEAANRFKPIVRRSKKEGIPVGGEETFWAMNIASKQFEQVTAILKKIGKHCYVYLEKGQHLDDEVIELITKEFDNKIYPIDTKFFGSEPRPGIDGDERITLLLMDIKDGWSPGKGYVGGYFFPLNQYSTKDFPQSNEREMFYLDIYPADPTDPEYMGVVAHEFQHLIHWNHDPRETKWVNEGCSQFAFHACGFNHPSQIIPFSLAPDHCLIDWKNTINDYGAVYLFFYYLFTKYDPKVILSPALVHNPGKGIEGIDAALKACNLNQTFAQIFTDWTIANVFSNLKEFNGKYGYDTTLPLKVFSKTINPFHAPVTIKDSVKSWGADYFQVYSKSFWKPYAPTVADVVEIPLEAPGIVIWSIDEGITPPSEYWPPNTREFEPGKSVLTRITKEPLIFKVGPFINKPIKKLNVSVFKEFIPINHAQISIYSEKPNFLPPKGNLHFSFKGKKSIFGPQEGLIVKVLAEGTPSKIIDVALDKNLSGQVEIQNLGTNFDRVAFTVTNTSNKEFEYELTVKFVPAQKTFADNLEALERCYELKNKLTEFLANRQNWLEPLFLATIDELDKLSRRTAELLDENKTPEAKINAELLRNKANNPAFELVHEILNRYTSFAKEHGEPENQQIKEILGDRTTPQTSQLPRDDNADTSHTNIHYLCNKKQELINSLTNLKIDPQFLEGQILQMYKILQLNLNLPNIPFPNGLGIVDYDESLAQAWIDQLRNGASPEEKEALRRLIIYEDLIEKVYNTNLIMAEDFGLCIYEIFRLALTGRKTLLSIANGLADVPIVGPLSKKVIRLIVGKSIGVVVRVINLLAARIKPPYNVLVPIATQIGGNIAAHFLKVEINEKDKWMMPWAAKTLSKYTFVSIPKSGYVAKTQPFVNAGIDKAKKLDFSGTTDKAKKAVLDDGNTSTFSSVYESFAFEIQKKHEFTLKEIEAAKIAKIIAQIAAYGTLIDPTNISKVAAIVATTFSGGVLTHGAISSAIEFAKADEALAAGLKKAFHPEQNNTIEKSIPNRVPIPSGKLANSLKLMGSMRADFSGIIKRIIEAYDSSNVTELRTLLGNLIGFEENFEASEKVWALSCDAVLVGTKEENKLDNLLSDGIKLDMLRARLLAELLPAAGGTMPSSDLKDVAIQADAAMKDYLNELAKILDGKTENAYSPRISITEIRSERILGGWKVTAIATSMMPRNCEVRFTLFGAPNTRIIKSPGAIKLDPWDSTQAEWILEGTDDVTGFPVSVAAETDNGIPGINMTLLE